jgi:hypothetical protein
MFRLGFVSFFIILNFTLGCQSPSVEKTKLPENRPPFLEGLYINQKSIFLPTQGTPLLEKMEALGMNLLVIDAQPKTPPRELIESLRSKGFWVVARIVNFEGGLKTIAPDPARLASIQTAIRNACQVGFQEIQLDYIRYADGGTDFTLSYEKRYESIISVIRQHKKNVRT